MDVRNCNTNRQNYFKWKNVSLGHICGKSGQRVVRKNSTWKKELQDGRITVGSGEEEEIPEIQTMLPKRVY